MIRKLTQLLLVTVMSFAMSTAVAAAAVNCEISDTGEGSVNNCEEQTDIDIEATCVNGVYVDNRNIQTSATGVVTVVDGGGATSGNATNSNNTVVTIGASCSGGLSSPGGDTPPTPALFSAPPTAGTPPAATVSQPSNTGTHTATLPDTGSKTVLTYAVIGVAGLATVLVSTQLGSALYRRLALK